MDICALPHNFIDRNCVQQKRVLNFCFMTPPHNGDSLSKKMYNLLCEWEIENKLFSVILDNASSNDVFVDILRTQLSIRKALICDGGFFHLHCCAHIYNLIVQDGLKEIDIVPTRWNSTFLMIWECSLVFTTSVLFVT